MLIKNDKIVQGALEYNKKKLDFVEDEEINEQLYDKIFANSYEQRTLE